MSFLIAVWFWPSQAGAADASRWALLCAIVPIALFFVKARMTAAHWVGLLLLGWAAVSLIWTPVKYDGVQALAELLVLAGAFLIAGGINLDKFYRGLGLGLWVSSALCLFQFYGVRPVTDLGVGAAGLFVNPNILGEITAVVFIALAYERSWIALGLLPALVLSGCRSAILAVGICALVELFRLWSWKSLFAWPLIGLGIFFAGASKWLSGASEAQRWDIWRDTWQGLSFWGHGIGSYYSLFPVAATHIDLARFQPAHAHNELMEFLFELGFPAVVIAGLLAVALFYTSAYREKLVLLAFGVVGMVGFPLHAPATLFVFGVVAGYSTRAWPIVCWRELFSGSGLYLRRKLFNYAAVRASDKNIPVQSRIPIRSAPINC